jgi:hypothetical protein
MNSSFLKKYFLFFKKFDQPVFQKLVKSVPPVYSIFTKSTDFRTDFQSSRLSAASTTPSAAAVVTPIPAVVAVPARASVIIVHWPERQLAQRLPH